MRHLFVTNDFPPKIGGIQTMLWELWRRLDPAEVTVLTTPYEGDRAWDAEAAFRVERTRERVLLPTPSLGRRIDALAREVGAGLILLDPALPVGLVGRRLRAAPYAIVVHGAEVTVPGRLPGTRAALGAVLRGASLVVAAGGYPAAEAERAAGRSLPVAQVPPGVDVDRFVPLDDAAREAARARFGLPPGARLVVSVSRLVPRKGMDVLIRAAALLAPQHPDLVVAIGGDGRDRRRLERLVASTGAPVRLLGRVPPRRPPRPLRVRRRLRHAVPEPVGGPRAGGLRHRVPRGRGCRCAPGRGRQRGSGRGRGGRRDRVRGAGPRRPGGGGRCPRPSPRRPGPGPGHGGVGRERAVTGFSYDVLAARLADAIGTASGFARG
jgi:phosphatidyl-myo-inositol dimannoside synthase